MGELVETSQSKSSSYYDEERSEMSAYVPTSAMRILDVGCAQGRFSAGLLKANSQLEIWGIEPSAAAAEIARQRLTRVLNMTIEEALENLPSRHFDCVVFNDVLEHLVDPWTVLKGFKTKLAEEAVVVASIPNIRYFPVLKQLLQEADFRYAEHGVLDRTHLRFFTKKSMQRLFIDSGYRLKHIEGIRRAAFPWKFGLMNLLSGNSFEDAGYERFALVASPA